MAFFFFIMQCQETVWKDHNPLDVRLYAMFCYKCEVKILLFYFFPMLVSNRPIAQTAANTEIIAAKMLSGFRNIAKEG